MKKEVQDAINFFLGKTKQQDEIIKNEALKFIMYSGVYTHYTISKDGEIVFYIYDKEGIIFRDISELIEYNIWYSLVKDL